MEKQTYDMRGHQSRIVRLWHFDKEAFVHMLFFRILIFYAVIYGLALIYSVLVHTLSYTKLLTAVFFILITPQLYESVKAFSLIGSKGLAFGHLSEEYVSTVKTKYHRTGVIYKAVPYIAMLLWAIGFVAMLMWWNL